VRERVWKESREAELRALTAPEVRDALRESRVELVTYAGFNLRGRVV